MCSQIQVLPLDVIVPAFDSRMYLSGDDSFVTGILVGIDGLSIGKKKRIDHFPQIRLRPCPDKQAHGLLKVLIPGIDHTDFALFTAHKSVQFIYLVTASSFEMKWYRDCIFRSC